MMSIIYTKYRGPDLKIFCGPPGLYFPDDRKDDLPSNTGSPWTKNQNRLFSTTTCKRPKGIGKDAQYHQSSEKCISKPQ